MARTPPSLRTVARWVALKTAGDLDPGARRGVEPLARLELAGVQPGVQFRDPERVAVRRGVRGGTSPWLPSVSMATESVPSRTEPLPRTRPTRLHGSRTETAGKPPRGDPPTVAVRKRLLPVPGIPSKHSFHIRKLTDQPGHAIGRNRKPLRLDDGLSTHHHLYVTHLDRTNQSMECRIGDQGDDTSALKESNHQARILSVAPDHTDGIIRTRRGQKFIDCTPIGRENLLDEIAIN